MMTAREAALQQKQAEHQARAAQAAQPRSSAAPLPSKVTPADVAEIRARLKAAEKELELARASTI